MLFQLFLINVCINLENSNMSIIEFNTKYRFLNPKVFTKFYFSLMCPYTIIVRTLNFSEGKIRITKFLKFQDWAKYELFEKF